MAADGKAQKKDEKPADEDGEEGSELQPQSRRLSYKRLVMLLAPVVLLVGGGGAAYSFGAFDALLGGGAHADAAPQEDEGPKQAIYFDLPEMLVNLNGNGKRASYLRVVVSLEVAKKDDLERLEQVKPRIVDNFQVFLRELRVEDLRGSAGMYRLKEELLARANESARPAAIKDVLFREMLVQ